MSEPLPSELIEAPQDVGTAAFFHSFSRVVASDEPKRLTQGALGSELFQEHNLGRAT